MDVVEEVYKKVQKKAKLKKYADEFLEASEFCSARDVLCKLTEHQEENNAKLDVLFKIAECDVMIERRIGTQTDRKIMQLLETDERTYSELQETTLRIKNSASVILHVYACRLVSRQANGHIAAKEIDRCIQSATEEIKEMMDKPQLKMRAQKLVPLTTEMLKEIRATNCEDEESKVLLEASSLNKVGHLYNRIGKTQISLEFLLDGQKMMEDRFGTNASEHYILSSLGNNTSYAYATNGEFDIAIPRQKKAISHLKNAKDIPRKDKEKLVAEFEGYLHNMVENSRGTRFTREKGKESDPSDQKIEQTDPTKIQARLRIVEMTGSTDEIAKPGRPSAKIGTGNDSVPLNTDATRDVVHQAQQSDAMKKSPTEATNPAETLVKVPKETQKDTLVEVGANIFVDHCKRLSENHDVFEGMLGNERVAVKKLLVTDRHRRETEIMKRLKPHPNTVQYKASSEWESKQIPGMKAIYLAMELCNKESLYELVKQSTYTSNDRIKALRQFFNGLSHIHENGIIHGDLKPQNVLCSIDGKNTKIADFGISKAVVTGRSLFTPSAGTVGWQAPEREVSKRSDIYSAGLVCYFVLSGGKDPPYDEKRLLKDGLDHDTSGLALALISRMVDSDPFKRPTAEECRQFPLFWDANKKLHFISAFSDRLDITEFTGRFDHEIDKSTHTVLGQNWVKNMVLTSDEMASIKARLLLETVKCDSKAIVEKALEHLSEAHDDTLLISALLRFIKTLSRSYEGESNQLTVIFGSKNGLWTFFHSRFPNLLNIVYDAARQVPKWTSETKCDFLCRVQNFPDTALHYERVKKSMFGENWLEKLTLSEEEKDMLQAEIRSRGSKYRIDCYVVFNTAVIKESIDGKAFYDKHSGYSLLTFIKDLQKSCRNEDTEMSLIFANNRNRVWDFFCKRFPNMFRIVHSTIVSLPIYSTILENMTASLGE